MKVTVRKLTLINAWIANIMSITRFDAVKKITLIIGAIFKFLFTFSMRNIISPLSVILVPLKRVVVNSKSIGFVYFDLSFVNAAIIVTVSSLSMGCAFQESSKVVWAVFKEKLSFAMKLIIGPFSMIKAFGWFDFFIGITEDSMCENLLSKLIGF